MTVQKTIRCAIYTRVSTDHGLDQDFNSLHAQREAGAAYIKSQASEGWRPVKEEFDDGGFSGGSLERPALQRLLRAIKGAQVDVVVVYKVDRLTRSLADFATLVGLFDAHGTSFVSVTQSFNTTTSMGRLTLNMLLSFAQFEREVTGERIRDKIAASKKRGIWVGGGLPLGYRVQDRKLVVEETEAALVTSIFERYLALGSLPALQRELRTRAIVTRQRTLSSGGIVGGVSFTNGPLAYLLRNRVYLGEVKHLGNSYPGEHAAIIAQDTFDAVQAKLDANRNNHRRRRMDSNALLLGRLFDDRGHPMTPSTAHKKQVRYRYYVSSMLAQGRPDEAGSVPRVSAPAIETAIIAALRARYLDAADVDDRNLIAQYVGRAVLGTGGIEIHLKGEGEGPPPHVDWSPESSVRRREILGPVNSPQDSMRPMRADARAVLIRAIAQGRCWLDEIVEGSVAGADVIAARDHCSRRHVERMISLAFLAPEIVAATIEGRLPLGVGVSRMADPPLAWAAQWQALGLQPMPRSASSR